MIGIQDKTTCCESDAESQMNRLSASGTATGKATTTTTMTAPTPLAVVTNHCPITNNQDELCVQRAVTFDNDDDETEIATTTNVTAVQHSQTSIEDSSEEDANANAKTKFDAIAATRISQLFTGDDDESLDEDFIVWSLHDFELIRKLGTGGAATVYHARQVHSGYHVALKGQKVNHGLSECEIDIHEPLSHENVVAFYDYFYSDSFFWTQQSQTQSNNNTSTNQDHDEPGDALPGRRYVYTILELCQQGSLYDVLRRQDGGRVKDERQAAQWIKGAMQALKYLHSRNILHGDVKTANFCVHANNQVKLTDFGFSVRTDEPSQEVEGGSILYMAPEHLRAWRDGLESDELDEGIDTYGLGVVLFEILVGDIPFAVLEEHNENVDPIEAMQDLASCWEGCDYVPAIIDMQALDEECTQVPPLNIPDFVSDDAKDLLQALLHPQPDKRISLSEALLHPWVQTHSLPM